MKKVKVRIAVRVAPNGEWSACGFDEAGDDVMLKGSEFDSDEGSVVHWVEAEVPVPVQRAGVTVPGEVVE